METTQDEKRAADESACRAAYDNRYHKIRAAVVYDEFRAIWFKALESHAAYEADLQRLAEIGNKLEAAGINDIPDLDDESEHVIFSVKKGTLSESGLKALQTVVRLVSEKTPFTVVSGDDGNGLINLARIVDEKFRSGNETPVERITITRAELLAGNVSQG